ncbi:MAG: CPBP family intramembrane metalloprotease [Candidatus Lokiarchaeota archaeon]|nr:CPBP family intramembrane metalloprotease [Candidatus Lokiarchaeota archaeon]
MANTNPIDEQYWREIWVLHDSEKQIEVHIKREHRLQLFKILLLAAALLLFFSVPLVPGSLVDIALDGRTVTACEALTFEAFRLDSDIFSPLTGAAAAQQYYWLCQFIYKWLGYGAAACLVYWVLFIDPYKKLRGGAGYREYIQQVVYEDPKRALVFLKKTLSDNKYRWAGFFYTWCVGCALCLLFEWSQWTWIAQRQYYWFSSTPSIVPVALILLLFINVCFGLVVGLARPRTRSGSRKKTAALAAVAACLFLTILLAIANADAIRDYVVNWNAYSIGYPEDEAVKDYFVNYTVLAWGFGIVLSALAAWLFPLCCTTYQNARFRRIVDDSYHAVTERHENAWEHAPLRRKHEKERRLRAFVRRFSAFELAFFFGLTLFMLWGVYFYWGTEAKNDTMVAIAIGVMAFEIIWALFLSPVLHHKLEKTITYQGKNVTWVLSEDRGIGSWQKYWKAVGWFESKGIPDDQIERKKSLDIAKHLAAFFVTMAVCVLGSTSILGGLLADAFGGEAYNFRTAFAVAFLLVFIFYTIELGRLVRRINMKKRGFERKGKAKAFLIIAIVAGIVAVAGCAVLALDSIEAAFDDKDALIGDAIYPLALVILILILYYTLIWPLCIRLSAVKSDRKFWKNWKRKNVERLPEEERARVVPIRRFVMILSLIFALWGCAMGMGEGDVYNALADFTGLHQQLVTGAMAVLYMAIAPMLLVYSTRILKFNDPKDPDRGKKRVYAVLFELLAAGLVIGIAFVFQKTMTWKEGTVEHVATLGENIALLLAPANLVQAAITFTVCSVLLIGVVFGLVLVCYPIFVRLDDLFKSIPDLLKIMFFGVILLGFWNLLCEWLFTQPRLHWSWKSDLDPVVMRDDFLVGDFLAGVGGYFFWGWVQELLFLGYFCWLLYKIQPNKWINAAISGLLFCMFHWDNIALMVGTGIGGFMWALWFGERRNLFIYAWQHGWNGTLVNMLIPMSMTVGPGAH